MSKIIFLIVFSVFFVVNITNSATTITGYNPITGVVTGSGTGFVADLETDVIKWEDFEGGTNLATISSGAMGSCFSCWTSFASVTSQGSESPKFSNLDNKTGSNLCSNHKFQSSTVEYSNSQLRWEPPSGTKYKDKLFISGWVKWTWGTTDQRGHQQKYLAIKLGDPAVSGTNALDSYPNVAVIAWEEQTGAGSTNSYSTSIRDDYAEDGTGTTAPSELKVVGVGKNPFGEGVWSQIEMYVLGDDVDGEVHQVMYNPTAEEVIRLSWTGPTLKDGLDYYWRVVDWGRTHANIAPPNTFVGNYYYDDIYLYEGWSRVVVQQSSVFLDGVYSIIQVPTGSTTSTISTTPNLSYLTPGSTAYVFVTDDEGSASNGFEFTVPLGTAPVVTLQADKEATSPTTYTGSFTVETGRTASTVESSSGFTVTCDDGDCTDEETEAFTVSGVTVPITDVITVTDSSAETGNDSITITLPTPTTTSASIKDAIIKDAILK